MKKNIFILFFMMITLNLYSKVFVPSNNPAPQKKTRDFIKKVYKESINIIKSRNIFGDYEKISALVTELVDKDASSKGIDPETAHMIKRLATTALVHDIVPGPHEAAIELPKSSEELENIAEFIWCQCGGAPARLDFIIQVIAATLQRFKNKESIVYTSLGTGWLLHDFLTITELIQAGYKDIIVNIIDIEYPDDIALPRTAQEKLKKLQDIIHEKNKRLLSEEYYTLQGEQVYTGHPWEAANIIDKFTLEITKYISRNKKNSNVHVYHFSSAYDYLSKLKILDQKKSDIITMVDPDRPAIYEIPDAEAFPTRSNTIIIQKGQTWNNACYILFPQQAAPVIWARQALFQADKSCFKNKLEHLTKNFPADMPKFNIYDFISELF